MNLDTKEGVPRRILPWIIERANSGEERARFEVTCNSVLHGELWDSIHDPAKLAELLAGEGRRLGLETRALTPKDGLACFAYVDDGEVVRSCLAMPQARTILAAWLAFPNDATKDASEAVKGIK